MFAVEIKNITKSYKDVIALNDISIDIDMNEIFGFIGPDGGGKTTLFRILTTLLIPDKGIAAVMGYDSVKEYKKIRSIVGYMPGRFSLYQDLTVEENLNFFASVFNTTIKANYDLIRDIYVLLEPFKNRKAGNLSGGMKQKLALCCALIHKPKILFLDEPTTGVDPVSRNEFWEMLKRLKKENISIVVSTPYMDEASLCDRIALIQKGNILDTGDVNYILSKFEKKLIAIKSENIAQLLHILRGYEYVNSAFSFGDSVHYTDKRNNFTIEEISKHITNNKINDFIIEEIKPNIEDSFMSLMK